MERLKESPTNQTKLVRVESAWHAMLEESLQRGFFGVVKMELLIDDGTIQRISRTVERVDKK